MSLVNIQDQTITSTNQIKRRKHDGSISSEFLSIQERMLELMENLVGNVGKVEEKIRVDFVQVNKFAKLPRKAYSTDSCFDMFAIDDVNIEPFSSVVLDSGLKLAFVTKGFGLALRTRSGHGKKGHLVFSGEVDNGFRGEIKIILTNNSTNVWQVKRGDAIAQFRIEKVEDVQVGFVDECTPSERGENGFGSTG